MSGLSLILLSPIVLRSEIYTDQAQFTSENSPKQICQWILMWKKNMGMDFFTGETVIMNYWLIFWPEATLHVNGSLITNTRLHKILIDGLDSCALKWISCLDSHSDGTHSLQMNTASDVMQHFSKSVLLKKQTHLHLGWPEAEHIFSIFSFNIPLKQYCG